MEKKLTYIEEVLEFMKGRVVTGGDSFNEDHDGLFAESIRIDFHDGNAVEFGVTEEGSLVDPVILRGLK
jgi:hypothetical protein